ncbi:MAG: UDP-glucose--hexose-1-phosphate uridylyltransferase [bacterium]
MSFNMSEHPHQRFNPLNGEWLLVSPHRGKRPWQGAVEDAIADNRPQYDPKCYLCPGNTRAEGVSNPKYASTFVFDNDFSALLPDTPDGVMNVNNLLRAKADRGKCRVICFSPRHDLTLPRMSIEDITGVINVWVDQYIELGACDYINYVQIFENKGAMMGCSNPHPHGQIWASENIPGEPAKELVNQSKYLAETQSCLLCDYLKIEAETKERIVVENDDFMVLVPFWATWPFETMLLPRRHVKSLAELTEKEKASLADILKKITCKYDNLFKCSFPYSMGWHHAPTDGGNHEEWHLHAHFYPPLLRSASVKKFMVGFEMLGNPQRDITAESAAKSLHGQSEVHYLEG